ncbi:MAG: helix-turn-helix domain containing protein [Proteobacteria bacterium]|nr:helix-turn-helix domain containing protein [Pseudomonadota bacterium]
MARRIPEHRFEDLVNAATEVFIARGYRLTQMSDVAEAVGVAKGTLYGYVEGKEALFALCLRNADRRRPIVRPETLPVPNPRPGELAAWVKQRLADESVTPLLDAALAIERNDDPRRELTEVVREFYLANSRNHRTIKLVDRCAAEHPEVGEIWQTGAREATRAAFARYIEMRVRAGQFRPVQSAQLAARFLIEVVATWAIHIHWDRFPERFDPVEARENAIEFVVRGLVA